MKNVILFIAHQINKYTIANYYKLYKEKPAGYDLFWGLHSDIRQTKELPEDVQVFRFTYSSLQELGYTPFFYDEGKTLGSVNFILQKFFKEHPDYDWYWSMEYDVVYKGAWHTFFESFDNKEEDFISAHIDFFEEGKNDTWYWWQPLILLDEDIPMTQYVKAFNPLYRISNSALKFMDTYLSLGNYGHFETLMSTALYNHGFKLLDYGGTGPFVTKDFENRFYLEDTGINSGTMRFRPIFSKKEIEESNITEKLFHPVKE